MTEIVHDPGRQLFRRGNQVGQSGVDGAARHAVELGRGRVLCYRQPSFVLDGAQAQGSVRTHARKDDAYAPLLLVVGQGTEEEIDGKTQSPGSDRVEQVQHPVEDGHILIGRYHIDTVGPDPHPIPGLIDLHGGGPLEQLNHDPFVRRVQVLNNHIGYAAPFRHISQELFQGFQSAGGSADSGNWKRKYSRGSCFFVRRSSGFQFVAAFFCSCFHTFIL